MTSARVYSCCVRVFFPAVIFMALLFLPSTSAHAKTSLSDCWRSLSSSVAWYEYALTRRALLVGARFLSEETVLRVAAEKAKWGPRREVQDPDFAIFQEKHRLYVSLTTSPERIEKLPALLETLDWDSIESLILSLPEKFSRSSKEYKIPTFLLTHPKIKILRPEVDEGPASKLLTAATYLRDLDPDALLVTIDDDTFYPRGMLRELSWIAYHRPGEVLTSSGRNWESMEIDGPRSLRQSPMQINDVRVSSIDLAEGYGGVLYWVENVPLELIRDLNEA